MKSLHITTDGDVSDGYHTFYDLYELRDLLYLNFLSLVPDAKITLCKNHYDGYDCITLHISDKQISFHVREKFRRNERLPFKYTVISKDRQESNYNGHTSNQVAFLLRDILDKKLSLTNTKVGKLTND